MKVPVSVTLSDDQSPQRGTPSPPWGVSLATLALSVALAGVIGWSVQRRPWDAGPPGPAPDRIGNVRVDAGVGHLHFDWDEVAPPVPPEPGPGPQPKPPGPVATGRLHVALVTDQATMTQDQATVRQQLTVANVLGPYDCAVRAYDVGQAELDSLGLRRFVTATPIVIFREQKAGEAVARVVGTPFAPASVDDVIAEAKRLRGAR